MSSFGRLGSRRMTSDTLTMENTVKMKIAVNYDGLDETKMQAGKYSKHRACFKVDQWVKQGFPDGDPTDAGFPAGLPICVIKSISEGGVTPSDCWRKCKSDEVIPSQE